MKPVGHPRNSLNLGFGNGESGRKKRGKAFKSRAEGEYKCFEAHDGAVYRPGDHVFVEISQTEPYVIGSINMFKMAKRDQLSIKITRYYRPDDVPEISYSLIIQERKEQGHYETTRELQVRELFSSETTTVHPISALRFVETPR
uniref:BAH domain-containing protein n=1 Tax=Acrobeloides nanus TaxID=290746 RepID=A0A914EGL6_9BILA